MREDHDDLRTLDDTPATWRNDAMLGASKYERNERDLYPTPEDVSTVICKVLLDNRLASPSWTIWEPASGTWKMASVLERHFKTVIGSDIEPIDKRGIQADFLRATIKAPFDAIITNPPFGDVIDDFISRGLYHIRSGRCKLVAYVARHELDCAVTRAPFFRDCPEYAGKITLLWRPRWIEGSKGSPRHNYGIYLWMASLAVTCQSGPHVYYAGRPCEES